MARNPGRKEGLKTGPGSPPVFPSGCLLAFEARKAGSPKPKRTSQDTTVNIQPITKKSGAGDEAGQGKDPGDHCGLSAEIPGRRDLQPSLQSVSPQPDKGHHTPLTFQQRKGTPVQDKTASEVPQSFTQCAAVVKTITHL